MKKLVTLLLAVAMVIGMVSGLAEGEMEGNMYLEGLPIVKEPVVYDIVANIQGHDVDPATVPHTIALNEATGVSFNWTVLTNAETNERIATIMASGDLPDMFINCLSNSDRLVYGPAGALLPVNEYIDKYAPNIVAALNDYPAAVTALTLPDGNMYSIPQINMWSVWPGNGAYVKTSVFINKKWLDAVGKDIPTTTEEFTEVLKAFRDMDPNGNGEKDEIPLSFRYDGWSETADALLYGPFGIVGYGTHENVEDGKVFYAIQDERYVEAIKWMSELYAEGLIDPEAFTMDNNRYYAKGQDGVYGVFCDWQGMGNEISEEDLYGEDPTYVQLAPLTGPEGACVWHNQSAGINQNYCNITTTAENPEILIRYCDYLFTEAESFQTLWGAFGDYSQDNGDGTYTYYTGSEYPEIFESSIRVMPAYFSDELITRVTVLNKDTGELSDKTGVIKYQQSLVAAPYCVKEFYPSTILLTDEENERMSIISTPVTNAIREKEIAWIMGQSNIEDDYEATMAELNNLGLTEMQAIRQAAYDRSIG